MAKGKLPDMYPRGEFNRKSTFILGCDPARTGADESALVVLEQPFSSTNIFVTYMEALHTPDLRDLIGRVLYLHKFFNFKKIYIDETGLGAGVTDILKGKLPGKVEGVWYTQKIKAEIFNNLKLLMQRPESKLYLPDYRTQDNAIIKKMYYQFLSISRTFKDNDPTRTPKISHESRTHDDIVNAICFYMFINKIIYFIIFIISLLHS